MRFRYGEAAVAGYGNRIWAKYTAKRGVQIVGMIFQTHSKQSKKISVHFRASGSVPIFYSLTFQFHKASSVFSQIVSEKGFLQDVRHNLRE